MWRQIKSSFVKPVLSLYHHVLTGCGRILWKHFQAPLKAQCSERRHFLLPVRFVWLGKMNVSCCRHVVCPLMSPPDWNKKEKEKIFCMGLCFLWVSYFSLQKCQTKIIEGRNKELTGQHFPLLKVSWLTSTWTMLRPLAEVSLWTHKRTTIVLLSLPEFFALVSLSRHFVLMDGFGLACEMGTTNAAMPFTLYCISGAVWWIVKMWSS